MPEFMIEAKVRFIIEAIDDHDAFEEAAKIIQTLDRTWMQFKIESADEGVSRIDTRDMQ